MPVPAALLQGSLLLGGATQAVLGSGTAAAASSAAGTAAAGAAAATIAVHPFVIGGWCGLVAVALNCLPVGSLDGGRMVQVGHLSVMLQHSDEATTCQQLTDSAAQICSECLDHECMSVRVRLHSRRRDCLRRMRTGQI